VWVVHGEAAGAPGASGAPGLDEISIAGETRVTELDAGSIRELTVTPEDAGLRRASIEALRGGDAAHNAARVRAVLAGERGPQRDAVVLNAGAALLVAGIAGSLREGVERAAEAIDSGAAMRLLEELVR
jgi:anthranilate phosphoribosyltransferase